MVGRVALKLSWSDPGTCRKAVALEPRPLDAKTAMAASVLFSPPGRPDSLISPKGNVARRSQSRGEDVRTRVTSSLMLSVT